MDDFRAPSGCIFIGKSESAVLFYTADSLFPMKMQPLGSRKSSVLEPKKKVTELCEVASRTPRVLGVRGRAVALFAVSELLLDQRS